MPQPQVIHGFHALAEDHKAALETATPAQITEHLALASMLGDVETCTYITAKHFDKLPADVQETLRASGLKQISDITQDLIDGKMDNPEAVKKDLMDKTDAALVQAVKGSDTVH